jgi:carboxyl-terminal processing protease
MVDAGKDIALEVERLKAANVDGIVLDVRDDEEVLYQLLLISLDFIEQGPIVQIKSAGRKKRFCDRDRIKIEWDGPLVMVNSFRASEILAKQL